MTDWGETRAVPTTQTATAAEPTKAGKLTGIHYVDALGLEVLPRPELGVAGLWLRAGQQEVHLLGIEGEPPLKEQHFAFAVGDLEALRTRLAVHGVHLSAAMRIPDVCLQAFTRDPSGNLLEFNQRL